MMTHPKAPAHRRPAHSALTLVEMVISMVLISVMLVAALGTVGSARMGQRTLADRLAGQQLAQELMAEILQQDYADPLAGRASFGLESEDVGTGSRALFDDVDDYDGWKPDPPQSRDGAPMSDLAGWKRQVSVKWADPANLKQDRLSDLGVKRIRVTITHNDVVVETLEAVKAVGPPATEACFFNDGTSLDLPPDVCIALGGRPQGPGTSTLTNSDSIGMRPRLLLVVSDDVSPTGQDLARQALMESFGFVVTLIDDGALQTDFDTAVAAANVAYVSEEILTGTLGTKLRDATIGVVIEEEKIHDEFGISSAETTFIEDSIDIIDNSHYITTSFSLGEITFAASPQAVGAPTGTLAPGLSTLALRPSSSYGMLDVIDQGGTLYNSGTAAGRRVKLPWGGNDFDINSLTADGQTIMHRAVEWAAGQDAGGGPGLSVILVHDIAMGSRSTGTSRYGRATIWIQTRAGADVVGALVSVQWSGAVTGSSQGVTGADGRILLESPKTTSGKTVICTVTDVVESGSTYNAFLNAETTDSIIMP